MIVHFEQMGLLDKLKAGFKMGSFIERLRSSKDKVIECGFYAVIGFFVGLICKRFLRIVLAALLFIGGMILLSHVGLLKFVINWDMIQRHTGIAVAELHLDPVHYICQILMRNSALFISFLIGFFLGLKIA